MNSLPGNRCDTEPDSFLVETLGNLFQVVQQRAADARAKFRFSDPDAQCSCDNLLAYLALREHDLQHLQLELAERGLSSLGRLEGSVLHSLRKVMGHVGIQPTVTPLMAPDFAQARSILSRRSAMLLGRPRPHHHTRIMVTLDPDVVRQPELLEQLLLKGMDIARVNCAHDTSHEWSMIITAVRDAEKRLASRGQAIGRSCRVFMDLAGPKVRTGPLMLTTRPLKLTVEKDDYGRPAAFWKDSLMPKHRKPNESAPRAPLRALLSPCPVKAASRTWCSAKNCGSRTPEVVYGFSACLSASVPQKFASGWRERPILKKEWNS